MKNSVLASKYRWNSSRASNLASGKAKLEEGSSRGARAGWNTFSVVTLVAATAALAHGFATYQANAKAARERNYSNPDKFVQPKYANVGDMEKVSALRIVVKR
jgi:D-lactate dehydrogenase (cytochrome)